MPGRPAAPSEPCGRARNAPCEFVYRVPIERAATAQSALACRPRLRPLVARVELLNYRKQRLVFKIQGEDFADALGFGRVHHELHLSHGVAQDRHAARPHSFAARRGELVAGSFANGLTPELDEAH